MRPWVLTGLAVRPRGSSHRQPRGAHLLRLAERGPGGLGQRPTPAHPQAHEFTAQAPPLPRPPPPGFAVGGTDNGVKAPASPPSPGNRCHDTPQTSDAVLRVKDEPTLPVHMVSVFTMRALKHVEYHLRGLSGRRGCARAASPAQRDRLGPTDGLQRLRAPGPPHLPATLRCRESGWRGTVRPAHGSALSPHT